MPWKGVLEGRDVTARTQKMTIDCPFSYAAQRFRDDGPGKTQANRNRLLTRSHPTPDCVKTRADAIIARVDNAR